jgi:hypothetical protein
MDIDNELFKIKASTDHVGNKKVQGSNTDAVQPRG